MKNEYVRSAVPIYPSIPEQIEKLSSLIGNTIGLNEYAIYRGVLVLWDGGRKGCGQYPFL